MSRAHLDKLRKCLEKKHWSVPVEQAHEWTICRPDGSHPLRLEFHQWHGPLGDWKETSIERSIGCHVVEEPTIDIYFGKFTGRFQQDVEIFVNEVDCLQPDERHDD